MTIHKWKLPNYGFWDIQVPKGVRFLSAQVQHGEIVIWGLVNPNELQTEIRRANVVYTGDYIDINTDNYIGTVQLEDGNIICHVFIQ